MPKALYNPDTGMIGCVLLQAAYRGDQQVSHLFDTSDWELAPVRGQVLLEATMDQWKFLAGLQREERVQRWKDHENASQG